MYYKVMVITMVVIIPTMKIIIIMIIIFSDQMDSLNHHIISKIIKIIMIIAIPGG